MASLLSFEVLPALNEGDESISLSDILNLRDSSLTEEELWAVCYECCIAMQGIHNSSDMFQTLCITPETLAFDILGSVCFLDLAADPETLYVPPEYEKVGNSYKSHLFSLGMTMLYAAEYNPEELGRRELGSPLSSLIAHMTSDDYEDRSNIDDVLKACEKNLTGQSSESICQQLASAVKLNSSAEEESVQGEEASILRSLTGRRNQLDSVGNDVQIWELSPSTSPLPKHYGRGEHERFSFFSHSPIENMEKPPSPTTETLIDLKEKTSMRLLGQLDAIVNRNNSKIFGMDGAITDNQEELAGKHKIEDYNGNSDAVDEVPIKAFRRENNFKTFDETVENFLDAPTPVKELAGTEELHVVGTAEVESQEMKTDEQKDKTNEAGNDKLGFFMEDDMNERGNKYDTDKNYAAEDAATDGGDLWSDSVEFIEESDGGREGSPGSSPASPRRGNFRSKLRGGPIIGTTRTSRTTAKLRMSSSNGFENGDSRAKEKVKSPRKAQVLQPIAELEPSISPTEQVSSMPQDLQITASSSVLSSFNTTSHNTHVGSLKNVTAERTAGASNITVNAHAQQQQVENTKATAAVDIEPNPKDSNASNATDDHLNKSAPGTDPSNANHANTLVNVLRQRVRSIRAADPVTSVATAGIPVGSPTPFTVVSSPVGSPPQQIYLGSPVGSPQDTKVTTQVHLQLSSNDSVQAQKGQGGEDMVVGSASTDCRDTSTPAAASGNTDSGSSSAMVGHFTPDGAPSTATTTTSLTSSSIHSQPSSSETSISHLSANSHTSRLNLPPSNSEQIPGSIPLSGAQASVQPGQALVDYTAPEFKQLSFNQGYVEGSTSFTGIPLSSVTSGIPVSVVGGRVIGPGGLPITGPGGIPITVGLNGSGVAPRGGDLFLMQGAAGINLDKSLLGPEDLLAIEMHPAVGTEPAGQDGSTTTDGLTAGQAAAGASGGSPDTAAQKQIVLEVLQKLGCGLHENELWALCRECILALHRHRFELPAYISLETVVIEDNGRVSFQPIPEDRELEVVYLAPELQQHGVVTEKTCLFGVAAMLWSAADYKLPANQEPALSEELENMLISMTQDAHWVRPSASDVLQECNEFQKKQDVTSTQVCQTLAHDAHKAEAFGKHNVLIQNAITDDIMKGAEAQKEKVMFMIKTQQLKQSLKPASERQLADLPVCQSTHDKLMEEILKPPRKLRKSSKPKMMPVAEIFNNDPEMMRGLLRITGKHRLEYTESAVSPPSSAFNALSQSQMPHDAPTSPDSPLSPSTKVPSAFSSTATHFTPIVLSEKDKPGEEKEKKVARTLKELKRNLLKNRQHLNLVQDIEHDAAQGDRSRSQTPGSKLRSKSTSSQPDMHQNPAISPHVLPGTTFLGQGPSPHLMHGIPQQQQAMHHGYMSAPQLHQQQMYQQQMYQTAGQFHAQAPGMVAPGQMMMQPGQYPHAQNPVLSPGVQQYGNVPFMGNNMYPAMPGMQNVQQGVQMQLQQDPRTGMFSLVPVQTVQNTNVQMPSVSPHYNQPALSPGYSGSPSQFNHQRQQSGDSSRGRLTSPEVDHHRLASPANSDHFHRQRSPGHVQSPNGDRNRGRVVSPESERYPRGSRNLSVSSPEDYDPFTGESYDDNLPRRHRKHSSGSRNGSSGRDRDTRDATHYRENSSNKSHGLSPTSFVTDKLPPTGKSRKQRPRSAGRYGRSKTLSGGDIGKELQRLRSMPSDLEKINEYAGNSRTLDHITAEEFMEYRKRSKSIGALEAPRTNLRRSSSGSSVDYRALEVKVRDIPIDGRRSREQSRERHDRSWDRRGRSGDWLEGSKDKTRTERREKSGDRRDRSGDRRRERSGDRRPSSGTQNNERNREENSPEEYRPRHRRPRSHKHHDSLSPVRSPLDGSPPASPPLSKDSGVSGLNIKGMGDVSLMERLLNSDTIRHQQKLSKVIRLLRDEFAFDGYMENGIEDLAMAEYVLSLANLKWETFNNAVSEKYCDLFWQEDLLAGLYESVNGQKPPPPRQVEKLTGATARVLDVEEPRSGNELSQSEMNGSQSGQSRRPRLSMGIRAKQIGNGSAFRPIASGGQLTQSSSNGEGHMYHSNSRSSGHTDTSDSTDNDIRDKKKRYRRKHGLDKSKSSSMHELTHDSVELQEGQLVKSLSQEALLDSNENLIQPHRIIKQHSDPANTQPSSRSRSSEYSPTVPRKPPRKPHNKIMYVRSSESENDSFESNTNASQSDDVMLSSQPHKNYDTAKIKSQSSHQLYKYDSDSDRALPEGMVMQRHNAAGRHMQRSVSRDDSLTSSTSVSNRSNTKRQAPLPTAMSESYLNTVGSTLESPTDDAPPRERLVGSVKDLDKERMFKGAVIYYAAEMEAKARQDIKDFAIQVDNRTREGIQAKMAELDQQMMMEHRMKKKTLKFYQKLFEASKTQKGDPRGMLSKVSQQLQEMNQKLDFLDAAKKHLEVLYAEQWGLDHSYLYAVAKCPGDTPMLLAPSENPMLQYQVVPPKEGKPGSQSEDEVHVLQAGFPDGLMAYLFAHFAISDGFIHQFFYCYRYFATAEELFTFLVNKYNAATLSLSPEADVPAKIKTRTLDLMQVWIEGYYSVDFKVNQELNRQMSTFLTKEVVPGDSQSEPLVELWDDCTDGRHIDLSYPQFSLSDDSEIQMLQAEMNVPKKWESFKAALHLSAKPMKIKSNPKAPVTCVDNKGDADREAYFPKPGSRRTDSFTLADYTSQTLAEQLTLIQQDLFRQSHPVHYLNSKAHGVGVQLASPSIAKSQSIYKLNIAWEGHEDSNLFCGNYMAEDIMQKLIEHGEAVSFWVSAEIMCSNSSKGQVALISKFIYTAKLCLDMRDYGTAVSIIDGLENVIVRQVPAWKNLPSKYASIMEELSAVKMFLKTDNMCLSSSSGRRQPTIPCILLFLLHVQQEEIGGFRLANGMIRWNKIKGICKVVDQIRQFQENRYSFIPDRELQSLLHHRMRELGQHDLHVLASQHDNNFQKIKSSGGVFSGFGRKKKTQK